MKKALMIGMVALTATMSFSSAYAAGARTVKEQLVEYIEKARNGVYGGVKTAAQLKAAQLEPVIENLLNQLEIPGIAVQIRPTLSGKEGLARIDSLVVIIAAKKLSVELEKANNPEAKSIAAAAESGAKVLANAALVGTTKDAPAEVTAALKKMEDLTERMVTSFSKEERKSYSEIIEKYNELAATSKSPEEAFVQAIMKVKGIDRNAAMEIVKKLKECV